MTFDYRAPAELFMAKRKGGARSWFISRRFVTAAEAIRFAVEDFPAIRALGAWLQVGNERFNSQDSTSATISLYDAELTKRSADCWRASVRSGAPRAVQPYW